MCGGVTENRSRASVQSPTMLHPATGRHRHYLGSVCITGPIEEQKIQVGCISGFLLFLLFWGLIAGFFVGKTNVLLAIAPGAFGALGLLNYLIAACIDPGIVPRRDKGREATGDEGVVDGGDPTDEGEEGRRLRHLEEAKQAEEAFSPTYCTHCHRHRRPFEGHYYCQRCDACVVENDHHCGVIGNCVAARNKSFFLVLLLDIQCVWWFGGLNLIFTICNFAIPSAPGDLGFQIVCWTLGAIEMVVLVFTVFVQFALAFGWAECLPPFAYCLDKIYVGNQGETREEILTRHQTKRYTLCESVNLPRTRVFGPCCPLFTFPISLVARNRREGTEAAFSTWYEREMYGASSPPPPPPRNEGDNGNGLRQSENEELLGGEAAIEMV